MGIEIDVGHPLIVGEQPFAAQGVNGEGDVGVDAEAFAGVRLGVVKSSAEVDGETVAEGLPTNSGFPKKAVPQERAPRDKASWVAWGIRDAASP